MISPLWVSDTSKLSRLLMVYSQPSTSLMTNILAIWHLSCGAPKKVQMARTSIGQTTTQISAMILQKFLPLILRFAAPDVQQPQSSSTLFCSENHRNQWIKPINSITLISFPALCDAVFLYPFDFVLIINTCLLTNAFPCLPYDEDWITSLHDVMSRLLKALQHLLELDHLK